MTTARKSPRCAGAGQVRPFAEVGRVIDCPECGRPMTVVNRAASYAYGTIPSHGSVETKGTRAADLRLRDRQRYQATP